MGLKKKLFLFVFFTSFSLNSFAVVNPLEEKLIGDSLTTFDPDGEVIDCESYNDYYTETTEPDFPIDTTTLSLCRLLSVRKKAQAEMEKIYTSIGLWEEQTIPSRSGILSQDELLILVPASEEETQKNGKPTDDFYYSLLNPLCNSSIIQRRIKTEFALENQKTSYENSFLRNNEVLFSLYVQAKSMSELIPMRLTEVGELPPKKKALAEKSIPIIRDRKYLRELCSQAGTWHKKFRCLLLYQNFALQLTNQGLALQGLFSSNYSSSLLSGQQSDEVDKLLESQNTTHQKEIEQADPKDLP